MKHEPTRRSALKRIALYTGGAAVVVVAGLGLRKSTESNASVDAHNFLTPGNSLDYLISQEQQYLSLPEDEVQAAKRKIFTLYKDIAQEIAKRPDLETFLSSSFHLVKSHGIKYGTGTALVPELAKSESKLDCDLLSILVLGLAEEFHYPVHAITLPSHMALRAGNRNFDLTAQDYQSAFPSNEHYIKVSAIWHEKADLSQAHVPRPITQAQINDGMYLRPLTKQELQAQILQHISKRLQESGNEDAATHLALYDKMMALDPNAEAIIQGKAGYLLGVSEAEALTFLEHNIALHPTYSMLRYRAAIIIGTEFVEAVGKKETYLNPLENQRVASALKRSYDHITTASRLSPNDKQIAGMRDTFQRVHDAFYLMTRLAKENYEAFKAIPVK